MRIGIGSFVASGKICKVLLLGVATMAIVLRRPEPDQARVLDALQALVERDFDNLITRTFVTALYTAQAPTWVAP